jgi:hypothetical protein
MSLAIRDNNRIDDYWRLLAIIGDYWRLLAIIGERRRFDKVQQASFIVDKFSLRLS